jgi:hypothetical protein
MKETTNLRSLIKVIERSEQAYEIYKNEQKYFQAIRIYNGNRLVYALLESLLLDDNDIDKKKIFNYLFHLDDWFSQFDEATRSRTVSLNDTFIFERLEGMFCFPKEFISELKGLY